MQISQIIIIIVVVIVIVLILWMGLTRAGYIPNFLDISFLCREKAKESPTSNIDVIRDDSSSTEQIE